MKLYTTPVRFLTVRFQISLKKGTVSKKRHRVKKGILGTKFVISVKKGIKKTFLGTFLSSFVKYLSPFVKKGITKGTVGVYSLVHTVLSQYY